MEEKKIKLRYDKRVVQFTVLFRKPWQKIVPQELGKYFCQIKDHSKYVIRDHATEITTSD